MLYKSFIDTVEQHSAYLDKLAVASSATLTSAASRPRREHEDELTDIVMLRNSSPHTVPVCAPPLCSCFRIPCPVHTRAVPW